MKQPSTAYLYNMVIASKSTEFKPPRLFVTDHTKEVVLMWFSVACLGVSYSVMFHLILVHYTFSSVLAAEWPPFGNSCPFGWPFVSLSYIICRSSMFSLSFVYL